MLQVQEPGAGPILESHGKPVRHDFFIAVGRFDAQLIELQELRGVGGAVVPRRQIWLELAWPGNATQLGGEGAAACRGCRGPLRGRSLVLARSALRHCRRRAVLMRWRGERRCSFSRPWDFLTASFFTRGRRARWITPRRRAPWCQVTVLGLRWWRHAMSPVARGWLRGRQGVGRRRRAPCGADELGDAVEPLLIEVVDGAVTQELVRHDERGPCLHGSAVRMRRRTSRVE